MTSKPSAEISRKLLPERCLVDTGVLIRALRQREDEHASACRLFFDAMIEHNKRMLVAAPTLAEILRGNPQPLPLTSSLVIVSFDRLAAELFAQRMPISVLKTHRSQTGLTLSYLKYDAMIVACAKRWDAECIVALDNDHVQLAEHMDVDVKSPHGFFETQTSIVFE